MATINVWVMMDQDGDYVVAKDQESLTEAWEAEYAAPTDCRTFEIELEVEPPAPTVIKAVVPIKQGAATMMIKS